MTEAQLLALLADHESDRVELTRAVAATDKFSEAVCAFANDLPDHRAPGYLIIGADDQGRCTGLAVTDELLRSLGGLRDDGNIQPLPSLVVEKIVTAGGEVAVVTVQPSALPPVRYRGRVCIRIGPRRGYATEQEERVLIEKRVAHARTFDAQPCLGAGLSDLSVSLFVVDYRHAVLAPEIIEENGRPVPQQMASLRFFDLARGCPTNAGMILFGLDVRAWFSGAYLQFLRIGGTSLDFPVLNDREIAGDLLTVLRELDAQVDAHLAQYPVDDSTLRERTVEAFPRIAVRELLINAVMHRDYASTAPVRITWFDDRVEIQSPGGLFGEASRDNFPRQTSYRNPVIAEALKGLGYVNRYGRGVLRAQAALQKNGSPPAEFTFDGGYVLATVRKRA
ncbi:MAG: ATP-binding protein [Gammaproteobacteria bacterium]